MTESATGAATEAAVFERLESQVRSYCRVWPTVFDTADNARQTDASGRSYIDFFAGAGVLNFGHNDARMRRALIAYLERGGVAHSLDMMTTAKAAFLARFEEVILKPRGMDYRLQFSGPTGTNAVEAALKLARKITGRTSVVAFSRGFHGMTLGALACTANGTHRAAAGVPLDHVVRVPFDGYTGATDDGDDGLDGLREALSDPSGGVPKPAAIMLETIQAEGGVNVARPEWLRAVQALAREHGALFIIDDIQVGCGRTGRYFSFEEMGLDPDIVVLAKGIGGFGLPLAMLMIKPGHDVWRPGEHTGTFRGQNLSFVAGTEALSYFEGGVDDAPLLAEVRDKGAHTQARLVEMVAGRYPIRHRGMIHGIDMGASERSAAVVERAFERGLIIASCGPAGRVVKVMAPLTIPSSDLDAGLDILADALEV